MLNHLDTLKRLLSHPENLFDTNYDPTGFQIRLNVYEMQHLRQALAGIEQADQSRWIAVSERLPEQRKPVLICIPNREEPVIGHLHSTRDKLFKKGAAFVDVTHWMPLPQPPKSAT